MTEQEPTNVPETPAAEGEATVPSTPQPTEPVAAEPEAAAPPAAAEETATAEPAPAPAPTRTRLPAGQWFWGTGRRKAAVARVRLRPGDGKFIVNKKPYDTFFTEERDRMDLQTVLKKTKTQSSVDVHVSVRGGGYTGQAGAIILGLGRALKEYDTSLEPILRDNNYLTRDPRKVERKKYGQPGARKRFQFSKR